MYSDVSQVLMYAKKNTSDRVSSISIVTTWRFHKERTFLLKVAKLLSYGVVPSGGIIEHNQLYKWLYLGSIYQLWQDEVLSKSLLLDWK